MPDWYLFGEKVLLERIEILRSRISDDPFIPELVKLKNEINNRNNMTCTNVCKNDIELI